LLGASPSPAAPTLRQEAQAFAKKGAWLDACRCYEELLRKERANTKACDAYRRAYRLCLRRLHQRLRHTDSAYSVAVAKLNAPEALDVYAEVLRIVSSAYVDRSKANLTKLFNEGLRELRFALEDAVFCRRHLGGVAPGAQKAFRARLAAWPARKIVSLAEAREQLDAVLKAARKERVLIREAQFSLFSMEFAAGACNALDEYTSFLVPGQFGAAQAAQQGRTVGVGLELTVENRKLRVSRVYPKGPAAEAEFPLLKGDRVLRIRDKDAGWQKVDKETADRAAALLRGDPGSWVEVEVERPDDPSGPHTVKLVRRAVVVPSVEYSVNSLADNTPVGYLRINHFQESTLQEVKDALIALQLPMSDSIKGLILDLRGNPGGLFKSAVSVAELFLSSGTIVNTLSPHKEYNRSYKAEGLNALTLPLVVLVDGETASAAEVLAGALQGQRRLTTLVGQTTYGKGTIQCLIPVDKAPLDKIPAGIRITVARFFSPTNKPYSGRGVTPKVTLPVVGDEEALTKAKEELEKLLPKVTPMMMASRDDAPPM
jgi:carboxyl-terminal processing protease